MKHLVKLIATLLAALMLLPVFAFIAYDALVFWPHRDDIQAILENADPLDRAPPPKIRSYIFAQFQEGASPAGVVAWQLHHRYLPRRGTLNSIMRSILWEKLVSLHFSQDEIAGLYSTLISNRHGHGLNVLSKHLFAKPLNELSDQEAATVVAYTWAPSVFERNPEGLMVRRDKLLSRVQEGPNK
jgi:hypothetical protein